MKKSIKFLVFGVSVCVFVMGFKIVSKADSINNVTNCTNGKNISIKYDDRVAIDSYYKGYKIAGVTNTNVSSYQVKNGNKTSTKDKAVLDLSNRSYFIGSGIGSCYAYLTSKANVSTVSKLFNQAYVKKLSKSNQKKYKKIKVIKVKVNVSAPKLTMMFLSGQSNMAGSCSNATGYHPEDSVICSTGRVYSTYASVGTSIAKCYTGVSNMAQVTANTTDTIVPSYLYADNNYNVLGKKMQYRLDTLSSRCNGKAGMDGAIAYEWRRLTGDKVWVVNASWGDTSIKDWTVKGTCYERALQLYKKTLNVCNQEIKAGHFKTGNKLMFFLQGEKDVKMDYNDYNQRFLAMYNGFISNNICERLGVVSVRAHLGNSNTNTKDVTMTVPRVSQYLRSIDSNCNKLFMVSNANEKWTSNADVSSYFRTKYKSGKYSYPLRNNTTLKSVATTVSQIHSDVHYSQAGHNENGIDAADNMYRIVYNKKNGTTKAHFVSTDGMSVTSLSLQTNTKALLVPIIDSFEASKKVSFKVSDTNISYDYKTGGVATSNKLGVSVINIIDNATNKVIAKCNVIVGTNSPVSLNSVKEENGGVKFTWNAVDSINLYRVYRKTQNTGWIMLGAVKGNSFVDKNYEKGQTYIYTVRGVNDANNTFLTAYDARGLIIQTQNNNANNNNGNNEKILDNHFEQNANVDYNQYNQPSYVNER